VTGKLLTLALVAFLGQNIGEKTDTSPHTARFVKVKDVNLHYLDWGGDGEPMVLLTGYGSTAHTFDDFATRFTGRFHVVSFTRRGTSPSERTPSGYDLATLTSDLEGFLNALGFEQVHLVGHSFAGTEMTRFATLHLPRVRSLVYIDAALDFAAGDALMQGPLFSIPQPQPGSPYAQVLGWLRSYMPDFSQLKSPAMAFYTTQLPLPIPRDAPAELRQRFDEFAQTKWIPLISRMAEKFRTETKGRAVVMDNVSHYIFRDREDEVVKTMEEFYAAVKK